MSLNFYDWDGNPFAYSDDDENIFTYGGKPIAYVSEDSIYSFEGKHIGYFTDGLIRDANGNALLFSDDATAGPLRPLKKLRPLKGLRELMPLKSLREIKPLRPLNTFNWSPHSPADIFRT